MIDVTGQDVLTLCQASRILPPGRNGAQPHLGTLLRWILKGARKSDGSLVRLEAIRFGNKWLTSRAAINKFCEELTPQLSDGQQPTPTPSVTPRTPGQRQR